MAKAIAPTMDLEFAEQQAPKEVLRDMIAQVEKKLAQIKERVFTKQNHGLKEQGNLAPEMN